MHMEVRISIGNKQLMLLLAVITGISAVGLVIAYGGSNPQVVGHSLGEIAPGTFNGGGNYIFPPDSNVQVQGNLEIGGNLNSGNLNVNSNLTVGQNITANMITSNTRKIACPSGFISVESQGRQLGCIQTAERGSATYWAAQQDCFATYGGRLPTTGEWYLAMNNYALTDETDDYEWMADTSYHMTLGFQGILCGSGSITTCSVLSPSTTGIPYRCWIPA